jgi:protein-L-isoaspartate O-methyltransferase
LVAGGLAALVPTPCQHETAYFCASVEIDPARPSGRLLLLDSLRHSYVDLEDPTHLEFRYERLFAAAVPDGPVDALHVGGGGFTFPRYLLATAPGSTNRVLELDPELVRLAQEELGLVTGPDLTVRTGDARTALEEEPTDAYDVVVVDAFGGLAPPWHLTTREVVEQEARALRAGGVLVANVIDGGAERFARAEAATLQAVFDEVAVILPPPGRSGARSNIVLVASDRPLVLRPVAPADGTAVTGAVVDRWVDGARILTDDFAPVDQLVARR